MRSAFKVLGWFVAVLIVLYIILTLVLHYAINPKTYKSLIENTVYKFTGHQMVINGDIQWRVFPNPSIKITDVLIKNQNGSTHVSPYFAKIKEANLQIRLRPLFSGDIVPKTVILRDANINLVYQAAKNNPVNKSTATAQPNTSQQHDSQYTLLKNTPLPNVTVINTNINWINLKTNDITNIKNVNLTIHPNNLNSALLKGNLMIVHDKQTAQLNLDTTLNSNSEHDQFSFKPLKFSGTATANNTTNTLSYSGPVDINLTLHNANIAAYTLTWNTLPMSGNVVVNWAKSNSGLTAQFTASTKIADGMINEKGQFNASNAGVNSLHYLLSIHHVNLAQVLKALHYDHLLKGTGNLTATLTASNANHKWIPNLNGNGNFKLSNAELGTLNSSNYLNEALKVLHSKPIRNTGITIFSNISGSFNIHNGVFYNNDLKMNAKKITAEGSGNIDLNTQSINYHVYLQHESYQDYTIPLVISGELHKPKVALDLKALGKNIIQKSVKKNLFKNLFNDKHLDLKKIF